MFNIPLLTSDGLTSTEDISLEMSLDDDILWEGSF